MNSHSRYQPTRRLYRNPETGIIMGVCSGLAEFFDFEIWVVRVLAVVSLLCFTTLTLVVYFVLGFLLRERPLEFQGRDEESGFWKGRSQGENNY